MNTCITKQLSIFVAVAFALLFASEPARAQGNANPQPIYTYVSQWGVPRAQWADMAKINANTKAFLDPFVANGTIIGYGFFENRVHSDGGFTHGDWIQATSLGNLLKMLEPVYAQPDVTGPVYGASKHLDYLVVSTSYKAGAVANATGYLRVISGQVQPGKMADFRNAYNRYLVPVYDKLVADGVVVSYELDTEYNIENAPGRAFAVATMRDGDALDKVEAAFSSAFAQNPAVGQSFAAILVPNSRNDFLARITSMTHK